MLDLEDVAEVVADAVRAATEPLHGRIKELEERPSVVSVCGAMIDRSGDLVLTCSDGTTMNVGPVAGKDGQDGRHGLHAEDVDAKVLSDGRTVEFSVRQGEYEYAFELAFPVPMYRGVFSGEGDYAKGDMVTFGGSLWHCNADTKEKPGTSDDWTLAVKKGRNGKGAV